jgi:PleD family two-component response regulator
VITHPDSLKGNKITISIGTATYKVGDDETSIYARADKAV